MPWCEHIALPADEHARLRRSLETKHGDLKDCEYPCKTIIESRLDEMEAGTLKAESLELVISAHEAMNLPGKGSQKVNLPADPEELRARIALLAKSYEIVKLKHPNRAFLSDVDDNTWIVHLKYILGDDVYRFNFNMHGTTHSINWHSV